MAASLGPADLERCRDKAMEMVYVRMFLLLLLVARCLLFVSVRVVFVVGWSVGGSVGGSVGRLAGWLVGCLVGWLGNVLKPVQGLRWLHLTPRAWWFICIPVCA